MYVMELAPVMQFADLFVTLSTVEIKIKRLIFQMGLNENQAHPAKEPPRSIFLEFSNNFVGSIGEQRTDWFFKLLTHKGVTLGTTGNREAAVAELCAVWESDALIMQAIFP